jgi:hypothetical protein
VYILFTDHAELRLKQNRQNGIVKSIIIKKLKSIPGKIVIATRFKIMHRNMMYDVVVHDRAKDNARCVITIIGYNK